MDDVIVIENDTTTIDNLMHKLNKEFSLEDLGKFTTFSGWKFKTFMAVFLFPKQSILETYSVG